MGDAKGKDTSRTPPNAPPVIPKRPPVIPPDGGNPREVLEEISLVIEPYGEVPTGASTSKERAQPEIYEVEGELLPFDASPDY